MEFEQWNKRSNEIANLIVQSESIDEIIANVNMEQDFEFLCINSVLNDKMILSLIEHLLNNGQEDIVENSIEYIASSMWDKLYSNEKFKTMFFNNPNKVFNNKSIILWDNIKGLINDERSMEFFQNNMDLILENFVSSGFEIGAMAEDLCLKTDYGEKLLLDNQNKLFENAHELHRAFLRMDKAGIDYTGFLPGVTNNIENIIKNDNGLNFLIPKINNMILNSDLPEDDIEKMKETILQEIMKQFDDVIDYKWGTSTFIEELRKIGIPQDFLRTKQNDILNHLSGEELLNYIGKCTKYEGIDEKYTVHDLVKVIYKENELVLDDPQTLKIIEQLITEISKNQGLDFLDVENAGKGAYSQVLKIGDFVLKIGEKRQNSKILYDKRLLRPIIRQETNPGIIDENPNLFIEVQNVVDTKWYENMSEEQRKEILYEIYADLRSRDIIWADAKEENVGRLLRDNRSNYYEDGEEIVGYDDATMMIGVNDEEVLKTGEYVIIDTDFLYNKDEIDGKAYSQAKYSYHKEFEKKYQEEQIKKTGGSKVSKAAIDFSEEMKRLASVGGEKDVSDLDVPVRDNEKKYEKDDGDR